MKLNREQQEAVEQIYGPMLVIAGPGTGKTQMLSMRVAEILQKTDANSSNILCLTYTEAGAIAMRKRLAQLIGDEGYKVPVYTFHGFGQEVINQYPQYFGAGRRDPADELKQLTIIDELYKKFTHSNPLKSLLSGKFANLLTITKAISDIKKGGLNPDSLALIVERDAEFIKQVTPRLSELMNTPRFNKTSIPQAQACINKLEITSTNHSNDHFPSLEETFSTTFGRAVEEAVATGKTKSLSDWRREWYEHSKSATKEWVPKDQRRLGVLGAVVQVYRDYQAALVERGLYDFDDMVLDVLLALQTHDDLRYDLQERYQFLLVDEFQDTNDAQLELIYQLTDNPVNEGKPNIMAVGDDDQGIYKFQGADTSNLLHFRQHYQTVREVVLTENYRSGKTILDLSRQAITKGESRLEDVLEHIDKRLTAQSGNGQGKVVATLHDTHQAEYGWVAKEIQQLIKDGTAPAQIAVLHPRRKALKQLLPHLDLLGVPYRFDQREGILEQESIKEILSLARAVQFLANGRHQEADSWVAQSLTADFWGLDQSDIWELSRLAYREHKFWLELMPSARGLKLKEIASFIETVSLMANRVSLPVMLDLLIGNQPVAIEGEDIYSPLKDYYFSDQQLKSAPEHYVAGLSGLARLREMTGDFAASQEAKLGDLLHLVDLHTENALPLNDESPLVVEPESVQILTAYGSKGLEFEAVFLLDVEEKKWVKPASGPRLLSYPANLSLAPAGEETDDWLRLFYVCLTRAKQRLYLARALVTDKNVETLPLQFLVDSGIPEKAIKLTSADKAEILTAQTTSQKLPKTLRDVLKPIIDNYVISPTHLNAWLERESDEQFIRDYLLHFPKAIEPALAFGNAIHQTLDWAHKLYLEKSRLPSITQISQQFERLLARQYLTRADFQRELARGKELLPKFVEIHRDLLANREAISELNLFGQHVVVDGVPITGKIDLLVMTGKQEMRVIDYKTGKAEYKWDKSEKMQKYQRQLVFYRLLLNEARDYRHLAVTRNGLVFVGAEDECCLDYEVTEDDLQGLHNDLKTMHNSLLELINQ